MQNSGVSSDSHLENWSLGVLISVILIVLITVSLQFQGQFVPIFFEASSQNCANLYRGYCLVIMQLTSSTWWAFPSLQDSSQNCCSSVAQLCLSL